MYNLSKAAQKSRGKSTSAQAGKYQRQMKDFNKRTSSANGMSLRKA